MLFKVSRRLGILAAVSNYPFVLASIALTPWFNFYDNALSDLGNLMINTPTAYVFNAGLILSGLFTFAFAILLSSSNHNWRYLIWTTPLTVTGISLTLVGVFPTGTGAIHGFVSITFFVTTIIALLAYSFSSWPLSSPRIGALALAFGMSSALIWSATWPWDGIAIQEALTYTLSSIWLLLVARAHT